MIKCRDTFALKSTSQPVEKVSQDFRHKSVAREAIIRAIEEYPGWVKVTTIAAEIGVSVEAVKKQLQRLRKAGFVDGDGKGRYRRHRERQQRKLKPCSSRPFPKSRKTGQERKTLTLSELKKRGWPMTLINEMFPVAGKDYLEKSIDLTPKIGRFITARVYSVSRIKAIELEPWFETERARSYARCKHSELAQCTRGVHESKVYR
jgi:hypothetical protein